MGRERCATSGRGEALVYILMIDAADHAVFARLDGSSHCIFAYIAYLENEIRARGEAEPDERRIRDVACWERNSVGLADAVRDL